MSDSTATRTPTFLVSDVICLVLVAALLMLILGVIPEAAMLAYCIVVVIGLGIAAATSLTAFHHRRTPARPMISVYILIVTVLSQAVALTLVGLHQI